MKAQIEKYLSGNSTDNEKRELLGWMREKGNLKEFEEVKQEWEAEAFTKKVSDRSKETWSSIQGELLKESQKQLRRSVRYMRIFRYAAILIAFVFIAGAGVKFISFNFGTGRQYSIVKADKGQLANVVLPDETEVWLNSGSFLKYNNSYASSNREVELVGEAYFSVTKNSKLPFIVKGSPIHVKVLGTKFNVSAYPEDKLFNVVLEEGSVELNSDIYKDFNKKLEPGRSAIFNKEDKTFHIEEVNVDLYTSWKNGLINIYNLPLEEVVIKLSKRYKQEFKVDEEIKQIRYTFSIRNESLPEILQLMKTITPISVSQEDDIISLKMQQ